MSGHPSESAARPAPSRRAAARVIELPECPAWCTAQGDHKIDAAHRGLVTTVCLAASDGAGSGDYDIEVTQLERVDWAARRLVVDEPTIDIVPDNPAGALLRDLGLKDARALIAALQRAVNIIDGRPGSSA